MIKNIVLIHLTLNIHNTLGKLQEIGGMFYQTNNSSDMWTRNMTSSDCETFPNQK